MDIDPKKREIKTHGTFELPMEFYDCNNRVYKDLYVHWHKEMEIIFVITGQITVCLNDSVVKGKTGDFIFIAPEAVHYIESGNELLMFKSLVFDLRVLNGSADDFCHNTLAEPLTSHQMKISDIINNTNENYEKIKEIFFSLAKCCEDKKMFYQLEAKSLIFKFFYELLRGGHFSRVSMVNNKLSLAVRKSLDYIQKNYAEELTTGMIAKQVHYNEFYFMKVFKKYTGKTMVEYITEYRLEKSKELLKKDDINIEEVAYKVGFSTTSYFTSKFREVFRVTPGEFRKLLNKNTKE